jgi:predicted nucleic acid-binding protein
LSAPTGMAVKVVDASAIAALLFTESQADAIEAQLRDASLFAPSLFEYELANVCLVKCRRHPEQKDALLAAFEHRADLGIDKLGVDAGEVLALALKTGLSAYDASYLWLSRRLGAELVTLDKALERAAALDR